MASCGLWGISRSEIIDKACISLGKAVSGICESHGVDHGKQVLDHVIKAIQVHSPPLDPEQETLIMLAALLHDADDAKFFKPVENGPTNAETILKACSNEKISPEQTQFVNMLIGFVSCSKNHNDIPCEAKNHPEYLYPRHADRLEAIGEIGAVRCCQYNRTTGAPLFVESTPRPKNEEELQGFIDPVRFQNYRSCSASMMDHYYDKLLHLSEFESGNEYLDKEAAVRGQIMRDICIYFGQHGELHPILAKA